MGGGGAIGMTIQPIKHSLKNKIKLHFAFCTGLLSKYLVHF